MTRAVASDSESLAEESPRISVPVAFLAFTALGLISFASFYLDDLTRDEQGTALRRALEESTGAYGAFVLFWLLVAVERRFPLTAGGWRRNWPAHVAGYVTYTVLHTTMLAASRRVIAPVIGLGAYDYGRMPMRYLMESATDLLACILLMTVLTGMRLQRALRQRELRAAALERDAATARLEALSLRLQPHFLFNALNTISSTVYDDPVAADEMIGRLGDLLRHALRTTERQEVSVDEELGLLRAYLTFVEARFGDRVQVSIDVDPGARSVAVPTLLLQPLVENAVRHGASREFGVARVTVSLAQSGDVLSLIVENDVDAPEFPTEPARHKQVPRFARDDRGPERVGTGLATTRDRLRLLHGTAASLETSLANGRFRVTIRIPARAAAIAPPATMDDVARAHR